MFLIVCCFSQPQAVKKKVEEPGTSFKVDEIPEPYRPSEWLCAVLPRKAPYHPQMGDECMYLKLVMITLLCLKLIVFNQSYFYHLNFFYRDTLDI